MPLRMDRFTSLTLGLCILLGLHPAGAQQPDSPILPPPPDVRYVPDLVYGVVADTELMLDVALPKDVAGPLPLIVCIHGGSWRGGHRRMCSPMMFFLAREGYVTAGVSYRLAPKHRFPAQLEDVRRAITWLRAHANEYHIDPQRVGVFGISSGGHLALLLATTQNGGAPDRPPSDPAGDTGIKAAVSYAGPTDLTADRWRGLTSGTVVDLIGGPYAENAERYEAASPITFVDAGDPPVMLFHGTNDLLVPIEQSQRFVDKLQSVGVSATLWKVGSAGHLWSKGDLIETRRAAIAFFARHLHPPESRTSPVSPSAIEPQTSE